MGEFLIFSVIARNGLEVLQLLLHEMHVCQGPLPHFFRTFVAELVKSFFLVGL